MLSIWLDRAFTLPAPACFHGAPALFEGRQRSHPALTVRCGYRWAIAVDVFLTFSKAKKNGKIFWSLLKVVQERYKFFCFFNLIIANVKYDVITNELPLELQSSDVFSLWVIVSTWTFLWSYVSEKYKPVTQNFTFFAHQFPNRNVFNSTFM